MNTKSSKVKHFEKAGIIYVMEEAAKKGFTYGDEDWLNLGQGAAEAGEIDGALKRLTDIKVDEVVQGYAPVAGRRILRENIAEMYNDLFREGDVKYSYKNIAVAGGGRVAISRTVASLQDAKVGYFVPDYSSYEGILEGFHNISSCPIFLNQESNFKIDIGLIKEEVKKQKINVLLFSNPCNPTGSLLSGEDLKALVDFAREENVLLIIDEFYFNYIYEGEKNLVSASEYIENIETDPVVIISGLSKSWRYSGFRVCWTLASEENTDNFSSVGSFLDGGANNPLQKAAEEIISADAIKKESIAIQKVFKAKRNFMVDRLCEMGIKIAGESKAAFYVWASLEDLSKEINTGDKFFEACLREKVIVVPGRFFDLNPGKSRTEKRFESMIRLSYGPEIGVIEKGMEAIERVINS